MMIHKKIDDMNTLYDKKINDIKGTIYEFFERISRNAQIKLFKDDLEFVKHNGALEKAYRSYTNYEKTMIEKLTKNGVKDIKKKYKLTKNNSFIVQKGKNYPIQEKITDFMGVRLYICLLNYLNETTDPKEKINQITSNDIEANPRQEFLKDFYIAFNDLLLLETTAVLDNYFLAIFKQLAGDNTSEISFFLSQTFSHTFLRIYHQNKTDPCIQRTTLTIEFGLAIINYIILKVHNARLDSFISILKPENFHNINDNKLNSIINLIKVMQKEGNLKEKQDFIENEFTYKKQRKGTQEFDIVKIDILYHDLLLEYLYDAVYALYNNYPKYIQSILFKYNITMDINITYRKQFKARMVRVGNLIVNIMLKHKLCKETMKKKGIKTLNMISLTNTNIMLGLEDYFNYNKPHLTENAINPITLRALAEEGGFAKYVTPRMMLLYEIQYKNKKRRIHANKSLSIYLKSPTHNYTPKFKYAIDLNMLQFFLTGMINYTTPAYENLYSSYYENIETILLNEHNEYAENILIFYDLSFTRIRMLLDKYPNIEENLIFHEALYSILRFTLLYNCLGYTEITEKIRNLAGGAKTYNGFLDIKALLDKVLQYKLNLVGLIKDAILYSRYNYFVAHSYLDARGRLYNSESFLNIQNNPTSKMFVTIYQDTRKNITLSTIKTLQEIMKTKTLDINNPNLFNLSSIKEVVKPQRQPKKKENIKRILSRKEQQREKENQIPQQLLDFFIANRQAYLTYIQSFFKSSLTTTDFISFLKQCGYRESLAPKNKEKNIHYLNRQKQLAFIKLHIKKLRKSWVVFRGIILLCKLSPKIKHLIAEYDFNNSGAQNIATFLNNIQLAHETNLIGKDEFDTYTFALNQYHTVLLELQRLLSDFENLLNLENLYKVVSPTAIFTTTWVECLNNNSTIDFNVILQYNLMDSPGIKTLFLQCYSKFAVFKDNIPKNIAILYCMVPSHEKNLIKEITKGCKKSYIQFCMYILVLRVAYNLQLYYIKYPWIKPNSVVWKERDIFKKPLMTSYYNSTRYTRVKHFQKFFLEYSQNYQQVVTGKDLYYLANNLELFFTKYSKIRLIGNTYMSLLTKKIIEKKKALVISNSFFDITMNPKKYQSVQVETRTLKNKKQQLSIKIPVSPTSDEPDTIDFKQLKTSITPNIIHSMDAWLVHCFNQKIRLINRELRRNVFYKHYLGRKTKDQAYSYSNIFTLITYTNHDNFACNVPVLVPLLLKECFMELIQSNYMHNLDLLTLSDIQELCPNSISISNTPNFSIQFLKAFESYTNPRFIK